MLEVYLYLITHVYSNAASAAVIALMQSVSAGRSVEGAQAASRAALETFAVALKNGIPQEAARVAAEAAANMVGEDDSTSAVAVEDISKVASDTYKNKCRNFL